MKYAKNKEIEKFNRQMDICAYRLILIYLMFRFVYNRTVIYTYNSI